MSARTDLALESAQAIKQSGNRTAKIEGVSQEKYEKDGLEVTLITIETEGASARLAKPQGRYITIESKAQRLDSHAEHFDGRVEVLASELSRLAGDCDDVLVIGLGNENITPDSLGPKTASQIFATRHIKKLATDFDTSDLNTVSVLATGVLGQTGVEAAEVVKAVAEKIKPKLVVAVDALACSDLSHLGSTIQLADTGISPGSGVQNARRELSEKTLGIPVIAIGVPTVVDMQTIAEEISATRGGVTGKFSGMMVTPRSVDNLIDRTARLIAMGINRAFQPSMTIEEITSLL